MLRVLHRSLIGTAKIALGLSGLVLGSALSLEAQAESHSSVTTEPGRTVKLGFYYVLQKDCSPGLQPAIAVTSGPTHGALLVRSGTVRVGSGKSCANTTAPAQVILYRANPSYLGQDEVAYQVRSAGGSSQAISVSITVAPATLETPAKPEPTSTGHGRRAMLRSTGVLAATAADAARLDAKAFWTSSLVR
jgi:hypothetical protein